MKIDINFLEFEKPIEKLQKQIDFLISDKTIKKKIDNKKLRLKKLIIENRKITKEIFSDLNAWEIVQLARHPMRPYTLDYIKYIFNDFDELSGDRYFSDDKAIVGGIARLGEKPVMIIGHQKGRKIEEKIFRNFGMPKPSGYRKALRLMKMANRFRIPLITFIDTPGAYPGIHAEEHGQSEAIAKNLQIMSSLRIPIICTIIGEGGSGGALAIGVGDRINMMEYSIYSVISPEGCASILWKDVKKASIAAESMCITAKKIKELNLIDQIVPEPLGGAHRNISKAAFFLKKQLSKDLLELSRFDEETLLQYRYNRLMQYGYC